MKLKSCGPKSSQHFCAVREALGLIDHGLRGYLEWIPIEQFLFWLALSREDRYTVRVIACLSRLLMIAVLGLLLGAANPQDPASAKDLEGLQGTWKLVSAMQDGKALPDDKVKKTTIVFKHDTFQFPELAEYATSRSGTIKLDARKKPKHMDAISTNKEVMLGIYELGGDSYKVCFAPAGKPRPSEFASNPGSGYILQVWEQKKSE